MTFERTGQTGKKQGRPDTLRAPRPRPWVGDAAAVVAGLGLGATVGVTLTAETSHQLAAPGGLVTFLGNLTGLVGTYLALLMVLLVSRLPAMERLLGQDGLLRWHRRLSPWPLTFIGLHVVLTTVGYAQTAHTNLASQMNSFLHSYPWMVAATVGAGLMLVAGGQSIRAIRSRMRRETWWMIHLVLYMALALSFAHVIVLGQSFVGHPLTKAVWSIAWVATAGLVLSYRVGLPVYRSLRHRFTVVSVRPEGPGVVSVVLRGRQVDKLRVSGGQFFAWRFLTRGLWWQAHPYSLSSLPQPPFVRLTVKAIGDHSAAIAGIHPGSRVAVEGPYGAFTRDVARHPRALLIAAGIGITALRSLLEDLPKKSEPVVVVRASSAEHLILQAEVAELVAHRRGQLHELLGPRESVTVDAELLGRLVPDLARRDVFVCGPEGFVADVVDMLLTAGVPRDVIHHEAFAW
ncbi:MAG: ferredoxin reductase family protein [Mycobacteriales bacterium]